MNNSSGAVEGNQGSVTTCPHWDNSSVLQWIKTIVYLFIVFLALFGNTSVIWIIFRHRRMRTATNYLIANMAVSLILTSCHHKASRKTRKLWHLEKLKKCRAIVNISLV